MKLEFSISRFFLLTRNTYFVLRSPRCFVEYLTGSILIELYENKSFKACQNKLDLNSELRSVFGHMSGLLRLLKRVHRGLNLVDLLLALELNDARL